MQEPTRSPKSGILPVLRALAETVAVVSASLVALYAIAIAVGPYWSPLGMLAGVVVAVLFVRGSGGTLADYGFRLPASVGTTVVTTLAIVAIAFVTFYVLDPILVPVFGSPDFQIFEPLEGNLPLYLTMLLMSWVGAAFGEEVIYRGFIQTRIALAAGDGNAGWWIGIILQATIFASLHTYQGWTGVIEIFVFGIGVGWLYRRSGRSLLPVILGHGIIDTIAMTAFYLGYGYAI
jgi:membrane protease YdiL (CAAX protease family)